MNSISSLNCSRRNCNNIRFGQGENNTSAQTQVPAQTNIQPSNVSVTGTPLPGSKRLNMSPLGIGAANAFCWFGVPFMIDKISNAFASEKHSSRPFLILGVASGLIMGTYSYLEAKKASKQV